MGSLKFSPGYSHAEPELKSTSTEAKHPTQQSRSLEKTWAQILAINCVTLGKSLNLSEAQFRHLHNRNSI